MNSSVCVCVCSIGNLCIRTSSYFLVVSVLEKKLFIRCQVNAFAYKANALARKHNIYFSKCADLVLIILDLLYSVAIQNHSNLMSCARAMFVPQLPNSETFLISFSNVLSSDAFQVISILLSTSTCCLSPQIATSLLAIQR